MIRLRIVLSKISNNIQVDHHQGYAHLFNTNKNVGINNTIREREREIIYLASHSYKHFLILQT